MQQFLSLTLAAAGLFRRPGAYCWSIRVAQLILFAAAGMTAFQLRFEFSIPHAMLPALWSAIALWVGVKAAVFHGLGLGRGLWRYFSTPDLTRVAAGNVLGSAIAAAVSLIAPVGIPRSVLVLDFLLCLLLTTGARAATRLVVELASASRIPRERRTLIYGAGQAGALLLRESRGNRSFPHRILGFIDDDPCKTGMLINGVPVLGRGTELGAIAESHRVHEALIAIPSADGAQMSRIVQACQRAGIHFRTMPAIAEMMGRPLAAQIRDVAVEDVLGRSAVELDRGRILGKLKGKVALVTGAAGSIGSELCRQIARFEPAALVALDVAETPLFDLDQEMRRNFPALCFHPEIGSIQNVHRLREVFRLHAPAVVYHAAAYKHVPLMEAHAFEAVENNVIGTYQVATVAAEFGVEDFVMISSDKAVHPTSLMGATKRVAELAIRSLQGAGPRYISVRFGNVLGSNGSVVPIFKRQIAAGGPVTVTHPEMRRYFMTIPEAAQLVLQASTMGKGGEIFVLDMGQPVRIADLARQLILLSGLRPDEDIRIEYTGIRPGEKLHEELNVEGETMLPTSHDKVKVFAGQRLAAERARRHLTALRGAAERRDLAALICELRDMVPDYNPSQELLDGMLTPGLASLAAAVSKDNHEYKSMPPMQRNAALPIALPVRH